MSSPQNRIVTCSHYGFRKSVSMDIALYSLFLLHHQSDESKALSAIRECMRNNWSENSLSRFIQRYCLSVVSRPILSCEVFGSDGFLQMDLL